MILVVCDVLVLKALEQMGKWIVRADRSRYRLLGDRPFWVAHTLWQPDDRTVDKALKNAWDIVPAVVEPCCGVTHAQVATALDRYVHDLVITGTSHTLAELTYRLHRLGIDDAAYADA